MAAPQKQEECEEVEDWLVTYADAITLLMAFFVMLLTFAEYDIPAFEELKEALAENVGKRDDEVSPTKQLKVELEDVVYDMQADQVVTVTVDKRGVVIELNSSAFYKPGSAEIREQAIPVLTNMVEMLTSPKYDTYSIEVEGHTDDIPIKTKMFPSNWELSAARATTVVRFGIAHGLDARKMKASGFGDTRPKVPNRDAEGQPIKENQSTNRRIAVRVEPMSLDEKNAYLDLRRAEEMAKLAKERAAELEKRKKQKEQQQSGGVQQPAPTQQVAQPQGQEQQPAQPAQ